MSAVPDDAPVSQYIAYFSWCQRIRYCRSVFTISRWLKRGPSHKQGCDLLNLVNLSKLDPGLEKELNLLETEYLTHLSNAPGMSAEQDQGYRDTFDLRMARALSKPIGDLRLHSQLNSTSQSPSESAITGRALANVDTLRSSATGAFVPSASGSLRHDHEPPPTAQPGLITPSELHDPGQSALNIGLILGAH